MALPAQDSFQFIQEANNEFLGLFPHRYDYIYAQHPQPGQRPQWQTETGHPLSDRLIQQGAYIYGVRFGPSTNYALLDIDIQSAYHPQQDPIAFERLIASLEALGLVANLTCTSSFSKGLHIYLPFNEALPSWQVGSGITAVLESEGFRVRPGQLEVFPQRKLLTLDSSQKLYNAHRLPLQQGSYLLNQDLEPTRSDRDRFFQEWQHCLHKNELDQTLLQRILKQKQRRSYRLSGRADKFLNDLNAEIELGWTDHGQTNRLLGRIAMRCYVFHHVIYGREPLKGNALVAEIVSVAQSLPGYDDWCNHRHEIEHRAQEWATCIENSHYFHYGDRAGKYKSKAATATEIEKSLSWHQAQAQSAQTKIRLAVSELLAQDLLPDKPTTRFNALRLYGIGGGTLYRYKEFWHPNLWKTSQAQISQKMDEALASALGAANASNPTSLLPDNSSNSLTDSAYSAHEPRSADEDSGNSAQAIRDRIRTQLEKTRSHSKLSALGQQQPYQLHLLQDYKSELLTRMGSFLLSSDPILMLEAGRWLEKQPDALQQLLETASNGQEREDMALQAAIAQQWVRLRWPAWQIRKLLYRHFDKATLAELTQTDRKVLLNQLFSHAKNGHHELVERAGVSSGPANIDILSQQP